MHNIFKIINISTYIQITVVATLNIYIQLIRIISNEVHALINSKINYIRAPSASRIREKMLYATSKDGIRRALDGISYEVQATDAAEMGFDVITNRAK